MESIQLNIPTMKSPHCQLTVRRLVEDAGATVQQISSGNALIELANGTTRESVVSAIEKGGYAVVNNSVRAGSCCSV